MITHAFEEKTRAHGKDRGQRRKGLYISISAMIGQSSEGRDIVKSLSECMQNLLLTDSTHSLEIYSEAPYVEHEHGFTVGEKKFRKFAFCALFVFPAHSHFLRNIFGKLYYFYLTLFRLSAVKHAVLSS